MIFKPSRIYVYTAAQTLDSDLSPIVPSFASVGIALYAHIVPKSFDVASREWGLDLARPHLLLADLSAAASFAVGDRVMLRESLGVSEIVTITVANATGGTFTLTYEGQTTSALAYNADATAVQTALRALTRIGATGIVCASTLAAGMTCTFAASLASLNVWDMSGASSLTHATLTPTLTVATNLKDRCFTVVAPPKLFNSGGQSDHIEVALEELEFGE